MRKDFFWLIVLGVFVAIVMVGGALVNPREVPVIWDAHDVPSCPAGYHVGVDEDAAHANAPDVTHCERD